VELLRKFFRRRSVLPAPTSELRRRIRDSFDAAVSDEERFPSTIDPRIYHVTVILRHLGDLVGGRILDVGCGKGRFAKIVKERQPQADVWAMDLSKKMLEYVSPEITRCAGSMTELPFRSASFEGAYATESLEHAVDIEKAVAEICRVVKPGGSIAIIDKNLAHWGRLQVPEWERWFGRKELERLLKRYCRNVSSDYISYWEDVKPDGLFIAWLARK